MLTYTTQSSLDTVSEWLEGFDSGQISRQARLTGSDLIADALACAAASCNEPIVTVIKDAVARGGSHGESTVIADPTPASLADAVLLNGTMTRAQDYNDAYMRGSAVGHPSDNVAPLLAVAEREGVSGSRFLEAVILCYELYCRMIDQWQADSGWDHTAISAFALPVAIAWMLELERSATQAAVELTTSFVRSSMEIRRGELSSAKSMANAAVAASACSFTYLARAGVSGPSGALDGDAGWLRTVGTGIELDHVFSSPLEGRLRIQDVSIKAFPCIGTAQGAVAAAITAHPDFLGLDPGAVKLALELPYSDVLAPQVEDNARWHPTTRETADHSIPYLIAAALLRGEVTAAQYEQRLWEDADVREVMGRLSISLEHASSLGPTGARLLISSPGRDQRSVEIQDAPGDPRNSIHGRALRTRLMRSLSEAWNKGVCKEVLGWLDAIEDQPSVASLTTLLRTERRTP